MDEQKNDDARCPFHRAEDAMRELSTAWRAKAKALEPHAARALAESLRSLQRILDSRIQAIEERDRAKGEEVRIPVKPDTGA